MSPTVTHTAHHQTHGRTQGFSLGDPDRRAEGREREFLGAAATDSPPATAALGDPTVTLGTFRQMLKSFLF